MNWIDSPLSLSFTARIEKFLASSQPYKLVGLNSVVPFAMTFSAHSNPEINKLPHLIVVPDMDTARDLQSALDFFFTDEKDLHIARF